MNWYWLSAGVLVLVTSLIHIWGGEFTLQRIPTAAFPTIPNGDSSIAKQEVRFGWHIGSVDFLVSGTVLVLLATTNWIEPVNVVARLIAVYFVGYGIVIAALPVMALHRLEPLLRSPQWLFAFVVASLAWWGSL